MHLRWEETKEGDTVHGARLTIETGAGFPIGPNVVRLDASSQEIYPRRSRAHLVDPAVTRWYHCMTRCVRRACLRGEGALDRKEWIEHRLEALAQVFGHRAQAARSRGSRLDSYYPGKKVSHP